MPKKRIAFYDNCKFMLIVLVVVGHFIEQNTSEAPIYKGLFLFIYMFHMPAFFFLSGLFDNKTTPTSKRLNKAIYYFSLYFVLKAVITLVQWIFTGNVKFNLLTEDGLPWFCLVLGVYTLLTGLFEKAGVNLKVMLALGVLLACFTGFDKNIGDYLCLSRAIVFYPFYLLGMITNKEKLESVLSKKALRICGFVVVAACLAACLMYTDKLYILRHLFTGRNPYKDSIRDFGPLLRLLCYSVTTAVGFSFMLIVPRRSLGFITDFGQRTMQIYFWHRPLLYVPVYLHLNDSLMTLGPVGKAAWILIAVIVTLILALKPFSFPSSHLQRWLVRKK